MLAREESSIFQIRKLIGQIIFSSSSILPPTATSFTPTHIDKLSDGNRRMEGRWMEAKGFFVVSGREVGGGEGIERICVPLTSLYFLVRNRRLYVSYKSPTLTSVDNSYASEICYRRFVEASRLKRLLLPCARL